MRPNRGLTRFQKERKRAEKGAAKRQERANRRQVEKPEPGAGPPIDYEARAADLELVADDDGDKPTS